MPMYRGVPLQSITRTRGRICQKKTTAPTKLEERMARAIQGIPLVSLFDSGDKLPPRKAIFLRLLNLAFLEGFNAYQLPI
jgi:hypothetical protein